MYDRFSDVPASGALFTEDRWAETLRAELRAIEAGTVPLEMALEHEVLLLLVRELATRGPVHVLDFGGGAGASYAWMRRQLPDADVEYVVVDLAASLRAGEAAFAGDRRIRFLRELQPGHRSDLVFVKSALQYVEDYSAVLRSLFAGGARHVLLEKFSGVAGRTYASAQVNVPGVALASWLISFDEIFREAAAAGYDRTLWRRLPRHYPQEGVPPERRMGQASTLVFTRRD